VLAVAWSHEAPSDVRLQPSRPRVEGPSELGQLITSAWGDSPQQLVEHSRFQSLVACEVRLRVETLVLVLALDDRSFHTESFSGFMG
jgi:hypothetical protein